MQSVKALQHIAKEKEALHEALTEQVRVRVKVRVRVRVRARVRVRHGDAHPGLRG